ncbi:TetR/AcrR family transcriptional regulator C-terminal domain-containing protein [Micromonospora sp. S4605]|uniref:TetR/AcrR family transcriptional regulator C-terminal domain-containing protein n=1 Tax=Micromonospora sp. S4605 TaxID=1420897 RepID=UPI0031598126
MNALLAVRCGRRGRRGNIRPAFIQCKFRRRLYLRCKNDGYEGGHMPARRTRGQNAGLTRQAILRAALVLADREGLKALSMRRIGQELGVEAMSLYQHVADKDALLDGLVEELFTQVAPTLLESTSWRAGLRQYAHALLEVLLAHPNVVPLVVTRPAITSSSLRLVENALRTLHAAGLTLPAALDMLYAVTGFVVGHAAMLHGDVRSNMANSRQPMPEVDPEEYPLLTEVARTAGPTGPNLRFEFALEAMLRGFGTGGDNEPGR